MRAGSGVDLDLAASHVDEPAGRDAGRTVDQGGQLAIIRQAGVGDLHDQGDVDRPGMMLGGIVDRPPQDAAIGLGLAVAVGDDR